MQEIASLVFEKFWQYFAFGTFATFSHGLSCASLTVVLLGFKQRIAIIYEYTGLH